MAPGMEFCLLGPLVVRRSGLAVPMPRGHQRTVLAALLLDANRPVGVDELAEAVWGRTPPSSAPVTVRNYVKRLRHALGEAGRARIRTQPGGYSISVDDGELDISRFEALVSGARAAARDGSWDQAARQARSALALWRGEPLADIGSEALALREIPRLAEMRLQAMETHIEADLHLGRHDDVITELRGLAGAHPLREHLHGLLMLALYRSGRQAEALAAYRHARRVLIDELGTEPGAALRELHQAVLTGSPGLAAPSLTPGAAPRPARVVPRQLPSAVPHFAGRAAELEALSRLSDQVGARTRTLMIAAIGGTAGVGKTTLAVHWAHQAADRFPDGQLYLNLRGFDPSGSPMTPAEGVRSFLDALQVPPDQVPAGLEAQGGLYRSMLAGRRMLIVLDNAADSAQVHPLLPGGGGCMVVVTSRRQLTALAAAAGAHPVGLEVFTDTEAHEFLAGRLGAGRLAAEPGAVDELALLCARLPLALGIAAARAAARPGFPLTALAAELGGVHGRLDALDGGEAGADVRAVFSWSYQQLSPAAARMFRLLGLHPGPDITVPAAASLAGAPRDQAGRAIAELTGASLLTEHRPGRFASHDLLRAYAAEQVSAVDTEDDRQAAIRRLTDHYLHTARAADSRLHPLRTPITPPAPHPGTRPEELVTHAQALAWFDAEHQVLLGVVNLAFSHGLDRCAWQLPWAMETFFYRRAHWRDWDATQGTGLIAAQRLGDPDGQAHAHRGIASACIELGRYDDAHRHLAAALSLREQAGDIAGQAQIHLDIARAFRGESRAALALEQDEIALRLYCATGNAVGEAVALNEAAWDLCGVGDYQRALVCGERALRLHRAAGNRHFEGATLDTLGRAHLHLGHHAEAAAFYRRAVDVTEELGHTYWKAIILTNAGDAFLRAGDVAAARDCWQRAVAAFDELRHPDAALVSAMLRDLGSHQSTGR